MVRKINSFKFTIFMFLLLIFFSSQNIFFDTVNCSAKNGETFHVGGTGASNYSTIQDAIDNSSNNDTIFVYSGLYNETLLINKSINLLGEDKNSTFIYGNESLYIIFIKSSQVNISQFTIQNGSIAIYISGSNCNFNNITNNVFTNNRECIHLYNSSNNKITCNNYESNSKYSIVMYESRKNNISENIFKDNYANIFLSKWSDNNLICGNNLTNYIFGITLDYSFYNIVQNNYIANGTRGLTLDYSNYNNVTNNEILKNNQHGIYIINSDNKDLNLNNFSGNGQDIKEEAQPPVISTPGFEFFLIICAVLFIFFSKKRVKYFKL